MTSATKIRPKVYGEVESTGEIKLSLAGSPQLSPQLAETARGDPLPPNATLASRGPDFPGPVSEMQPAKRQSMTPTGCAHGASVPLRATSAHQVVTQRPPPFGTFVPGTTATEASAEGVASPCHTEEPLQLQGSISDRSFQSPASRLVPSVRYTNPVVCDIDFCRAARYTCQIWHFEYPVS